MNGLIRNRLIYALLGSLLFASACSQASGQSGNTSAVHAAETAAGTVAETIAYGKKVYEGNCAACHQVDGRGLTGAFPPLAGSDYLRGEREDVLAVALFGLSGPITVNGQDFNAMMPSMGPVGVCACRWRRAVTHVVVTTVSHTHVAMA